MKVYAAPENIAKPRWDWKTTREENDKDEKRYIAEIEAWMRANGFTGPYTGGIVRFPIADGYAQYMLADAPKKSFLIHLDICDGWNARDAEFVPKKEIIKRIEQERNRAKLFASR